MKDFDLHTYFLLKEAQENEEDPSQNPNQDVNQNVPAPGQPQQPNSPPQKQNSASGNQNLPQSEMMKKPEKQTSSIFSQFAGSTISDIGFKKNGNGGELSISLSKSNMPLKISWIGDKVTVTQPNGNIVSL